MSFLLRQGRDGCYAGPGRLARSTGGFAWSVKALFAPSAFLAGTSPRNYQSSVDTTPKATAPTRQQPNRHSKLVVRRSLKSPDLAGVAADDLPAVLVASYGDDVADGFGGVAESAFRVGVIRCPEELVRADVRQQFHPDRVFLERGVAVLPPVVARHLCEL